jgi:hypothetical protein
MGKKIYLITRNKYFLNVILKFRLNFFDSTILVNDKEKKSSFVKGENSIFIDDSFREREDVRETLGIPVFDTNSIECLIDHRG